ncbi:class I SAM-dependent methyltransferase [Mycobacterium sp. DSM 3803]|nr:class I SAM-dependent methyltransferase [Mycobacterium sp. DSM 3803]
MTGLTSKFNVRWTPRTLTFLFVWWMARACPSVLAHYLTGSLRHGFVKGAPASDTSAHIAQIRKEFEVQAAQGEFKERWFDMNIEQWCVTFSRELNRADELRILEIGSWEGRSTLFFLNYFPNAQLTAVDTWAGSDEHHFNATPDLRDLETRFDGNLGPHAARVVKRKGSSLYVLPQLIDEAEEYDLIYVDGSHFADDALTDSVNAWRLLKQGGVMIFDDVMWPAYRRAHANTAWAIASFLKYHAREFSILHAGYQIIIRKRVSFVDRPAEWVGKHPVHDVASELSGDNHQSQETRQQFAG